MARVDWSKHERLLGTLPDAELAERIGCDPNAVRIARRRYGRPAVFRCRACRRVFPCPWKVYCDGCRAGAQRASRRAADVRHYEKQCAAAGREALRRRRGVDAAAEERRAQALRLWNVYNSTRALRPAG